MFLSEEKLLNPNQSGFRPSDSCINQLIEITHEIFKAFDLTATLLSKLDLFSWTYLKPLIKFGTKI